MDEGMVSTRLGQIRTATWVEETSQAYPVLWDEWLRAV